jgi:D-alanyl-D-alanine carboxypeptidase
MSHPALIVATMVSFVAFVVHAQEISPDALVRAYPDQIAGRDDTGIILRDGTRQNLSDGKTDKSFDEKLKNGSLIDQLSLPYPKGVLTKPPGPQDDPGRIRNTAFFDKMYGDCDKGETQKHLIDIRWFTGKVRVTTVNGVAERLRAVAMEIDHLPKNIKRYAYPSAGAFNCRVVKDTGKRSMHAYGAAIDINTAFSDYWLWRKGGYHNRIPYEIVEIFERHGFIWGGKWGHFDTMHFEYRPEFFDTPPGTDETKRHSD